MAPRRSARGGAADATATPPAQPLEGFTIALSGSFTNFANHTHGTLEKVIRNMGGVTTKSVTQKTTHVICSQTDYTNDAVKVAAAKAKGLPLIHPMWVLELEGQKNVATDPKDYDWADSQSKAYHTSTTTTNLTSTNGKKRPITNVQDDAEEDQKADSAAKPNPKKTKSSAKGKEILQVEETAAEGQFVKNKDRAVVSVDEFCSLVAQGYEVYIDEDGLIWDAALNQTNATHNNNKFYKIQILHKSNQDHRTWTRWGRVGEAGANAILGDGSLLSAQKNFEKKFRDKSGLPWDKRGSDPKPGKYAFIEKSYDPDSDREDGDDKPSKSLDNTSDVDNGKPAPECSLSTPVQELMQLIFNQSIFAATMKSLNYDANKMPLGKLSKTTISRGFQQLKDLAALLDDSSLAMSQWNMSFPAATEHLSNTYYSLIPHAFGRNRPPVISNDRMLKDELTLLESLSDMKDATEIMKIDRNAAKDAIHPLDEQYRRLGMNEMISLEHDSREFTMLKDYLQGSKGSTHHMQYTVRQIFRIERHGEKQRFDSSRYASIKSDKRLLWHGSRTTNFGGILSQGLRIAPPEAPVSGYMFGKGIYLADMSSKSAGYCCHYNSNNEALLLLCEAELGAPMHKLVHASYTAGEDAKAAGKVATWGQGHTGPSKWADGGLVCDGLKGVKIPDPKVPPSDTKVANAGLFYNEYICYDVAQVKLRYLFRVKIN